MTVRYRQKFWRLFRECLDNQNVDYTEVKHSNKRYFKGLELDRFEVPEDDFFKNFNG